MSCVCERLSSAVLGWIGSFYYMYVMTFVSVYNIYLLCVRMYKISSNIKHLL